MSKNSKNCQERPKIPKIIVILGPTSSGKSDVAIHLARKFKGEIISADSRQIYRGMDIGSGKVTPEEQKMAPHHMLDIVNPKTDYNVAKFKKQTEKILIDILKRGKTPVICGGTGFWIKAIVDDIDFPKVKPDWKLREKLEKQSAEKLFKKLQKIDPERAAGIDSKNKVRLIRAIEICQSIGKVPEIKNNPPKKNRWEFLQIGIEMEKEKLHLRIKKRLEARFKIGMIEEVKKLHETNKASWKRLDSFGLEYRWISRYLQNKISLEEMNEKLYFDIIHYAKRQMTWFKKNKEAIWLENQEEIDKAVGEFLKK